MPIQHGETAITAVNHGTVSLTAVKHNTIDVFPDTPTAYTMTFSKNSYSGDWDNTSSATIYAGDYIQVSDAFTSTTVYCKAGGSTGSTRWSRTASQKAATALYIYSTPTLYKGTTTGTGLSSGTYDGSFTNIYAYATRSTTPVIITYSIGYTNSGTEGSQTGGVSLYRTSSAAQTIDLGTYSTTALPGCTYGLHIDCSNIAVTTTITSTDTAEWTATATIPARTAEDLTFTWEIIRTAPSYIMTFTKDRLTTWNSAASVTIYAGDTLHVTKDNGNLRTTVVCSSPEGVTRWTKIASVKFGKAAPTIFKGTASIVVNELTDGTLYDGTYTNLYAAMI